MSKSPDAFRTISEVSEWLDTPTYVLRFWESRFPQIKPVKRAGGRRYYRPDDMLLLGGIKQLLHFEDEPIKAVKNLLKEKGVKHVMGLSPDLNTQVVSPPSRADANAKAEIEKMVKSQPTAQEKPLAPEKPVVEVRVVKKAKLAEEAAKIAPEETVMEAQDQTTADETANQAAGETANDWDSVVPDMVRHVPYRIQTATAYDQDRLGEIETLYYDLRMARNAMRRSIKKHEQQVADILSA